MAEKKPADPDVRKSFQEYLAASPAVEEPMDNVVLSVLARGPIISGARQWSLR